MLSRVVTFFMCCLVALPVSAADDLWEWVTPWPQGHGLKAAAAGNGVWVAVGEKGTVVTSTDGIEWWTTHTGADYGLRNVVWGNGLFVAVGGALGGGGGPEPSPFYGVVLTSTDGINWTERVRTDGLPLSGVAWFGSRFVVIGYGSEVLFSPDGISWWRRNIDRYIGKMIGPAWNGSTLVMIAQGGPSQWPPLPAGVFISEDGEHWSLGRGFTHEFMPAGIAALGGRFVIVGRDHKPGGESVWVSDDGWAWTEVPYEAPEGIGYGFSKIVAGGDRFIAWEPGIVGTSLDGYVWLVEEKTVAQGKAYKIEWLGDGYLAVGAEGFMMSSPDGSEWAELSGECFDSKLHSVREIRELAEGGGTIVGVGRHGHIITSRYGKEWTLQRSPAKHDLNAVLWAGTAFWTVGGQWIFRSADGVHWAPMFRNPDYTLYDIVWNGSLFVAVGREYSRDLGYGRTVVLTSPDGDEWSSEWFDIEGMLFTVGWTGSQFVAVGQPGHYLTSSDGEVWQKQPADEYLYLTDMAWNGDRLVAVGRRRGDGGVIRSTTDGFNWVESVLPEDDVSEFDDVTWTGTHFVAVSSSSGDVIFTSRDGVSWSSETTGTGVWPISAVGDDRNLFVIGGGFKIIRRTRPLADPEPPRRPSRRLSPVAEKARTTIQGLASAHPSP